MILQSHRGLSVVCCVYTQAVAVPCQSTNPFAQAQQVEMTMNQILLQLWHQLIN